MESGLTEEEAYQAVQRHARERRISMADAAREILGGSKPCRCACHPHFLLQLVVTRIER